MTFDIHLFHDNDTTLLFVFKCPSGHLPKKVVRSDGSEHFFPVQKCEKCRGKIISKTERNGNQFKFIDTCSFCEHVLIDEFTIEDKWEVSVEDRKKYCSSFNNARTFYEDLEAIANFAESVKSAEKEKKEQKELEMAKIERPTIPQLEKKLLTIASESGFIKLQFDKPEIGRHVIVPFSLQDPSNRTENESIKTIAKQFKSELFPTNWRLMSEGISYRLGHLTGRIKSFEQKDDLLKIAKEIQAEQKKELK